VTSRTYACVKRVLANANPVRRGDEWLYPWRRLRHSAGGPEQQDRQQRLHEGLRQVVGALGRLHQREDRMTPAELTERASEVIRRAQQLMDTPDAEDEERWGAALRLIDATMENDALVFRFIEPDGRRINYCWLLHRDDEGYDAFANPEKSLRLLSSTFQEDVLTQERSDPDTEGVRWFGDED